MKKTSVAAILAVLAMASYNGVANSGDNGSSVPAVRTAAETKQWVYVGTVLIYKYNPTSVTTRPANGTVFASDEGVARLLAKNDAESKFRGRGDLIVATILVVKPMN